MEMKPSQEKIMSMSKKISIVLKLGFIVSNGIVILSLIAIGILVFSKEDIKSSFLAAFNVTANNGTTISIETQSLLVLFAFMLIDTIIGCLFVFLYTFSNMIWSKNFIMIMIIGMLSISADTFMNGFKQNNIHIHHHVIRLIVETGITIICWIGR